MKKWRNFSLIFMFFYGVVVALALNDYLKLRSQIQTVQESPGREQIESEYEDCKLQAWSKQADCLVEANTKAQIPILPSYGHLLASKRTADFIQEQVEFEGRMLRSIDAPSEETARKYNLAMIDSGLAMVKITIAEYEAMQARVFPDSFSIRLSSTVENLSRRMADEKFARSLEENFEAVQKNIDSAEGTIIGAEVPFKRDELRELRDRFELAQARERANQDKDSFGSWLWRQTRPLFDERP